MNMQSLPKIPEQFKFKGLVTMNGKDFYILAESKEMWASFRWDGVSAQYSKESVYRKVKPSIS